MRRSAYTFVTAAATAATLLLSAACDTPIDLDGLTPLPDEAELDLAVIALAEPVDYWEFRIGSPTAVWQVLGGAGTKTRDQLDSATLATFDSTIPPTGSSHRCLPGDCFFYVAAIRNDSIWSYSTPDELLTFLGPLGTIEEAALLVTFHDFDLGGDLDESGYRAAADGWELLVLKLVAYCDPIQTDRFLLHVSSSGVVTERSREVWRQSFGVCI
ncbi:MAG TPA: hypothetical protein VGA22_06995 [Gemmatimonadales bacterium]|jgi:hypothetical protein